MSDTEMLEERLRGFLAAPDEADWDDVLRRADALPLGPRRGRRRGATRRRRRPLLVTAAAAAALAGAGVAIAAGFGVFRGISAAQHPVTAADGLDPVVAASLATELNGALSNPLQSDKSLHFARLATLKSALSAREQASDQPAERLQRRRGSVLAAIVSILATTADPMRVRDIHTAVEELLSGPVAYSSVKEALSVHSRGSGRRFRRTRRGYYQLGTQAIRRC